MTGAVELMEDVLDNHEKDGLFPLKENRLRRMDRPMLVCDSDMAPRPDAAAHTSLKWARAATAATLSSHGVGGGVGVDSTAASDRILSRGVIGSPIVPGSI